ncbi:unnamed protein product, partial [Durusdinium trenchii]
EGEDEDCVILSATIPKRARLVIGQDECIIVDEEEVAQHLFMEFYSPPRVCIPLRREGFRAFYSFDLDTGYDFTDFGGRARAWKLLIRYRPFFTMLSAPCTMFSTMMNANFGKMSPEIKAKRFSEAECHLAYSMNVATHQIREERFFAHEHPHRATSWKRRCVVDVQNRPGVQTVSFDQCQVNLRTPVSNKLIKKRTTLMTNSSAIVQLFAPLQCTCSEPHATIEGSEGGILLSKWCQKYTPEFVDLLQRAVRMEAEQRRA